MPNSEYSLTITSHRGPYTVSFITDPFEILLNEIPKKSVLLIDKNVSILYKAQLEKILSKYPSLIIEANERNKDLTEFTSYACSLVELQVKRDYTLVAIGGGILQDITCFLASTMFRGMPWIFFPTTLLAQADSCIGSKSSINVGGIKNLMGTFLPPNKIYLATSFLNTLDTKDIYSGIGEMIKVHGIAGIKFLKEFNDAYGRIIQSRDTLTEYIYKSLQHKKVIIEQDEFDTGIRNIMNYGHTFGHALESATDFEIPHGISITIGQAMACTYSFERKLISDETFTLAKNLLIKNFENSKNVPIEFSKFRDSIKKDKKNVDSKIAIIIPTNEQFKIEKYFVEADEGFFNFCKHFFKDNGFNLNE